MPLAEPPAPLGVVQEVSLEVTLDLLSEVGGSWLW